MKKNILITGGTSGIGFNAAKTLVKSPENNLILIGKNIDKFLLKNNFDLPIFFWDESYTSVEAEDITKDFFKNSKEQNRHIDKFAAKLVLDDFFNENLDEKKNY